MNQIKKITEWNPKELSEKLSECELIDVRGDDEFNGPLSHVRNSRLVTLGPDLEQFLKNSIESLQTKTIVFICRSGGRSLRAAEYAASLGYTNPINLKGGMIAWNEDKLPTAKT